MIVEDQRDVVRFLMRPETHGGATVERIDTHSAMVFLAGQRALKLKRAVRFDYLDFGTLERRREACQAEVRINRRTAPSVYRGVVAVTRDAAGALALGSDGTPVDWLVEMTRFDQDALLDRLAAAGRLDLALMRPLAETIAAFHRDAERRPDHGGAAGMRWVVDGNAEGFADQGRGMLDPAQAERVTALARTELDRQAGRLERRRTDGFVRQCHGDLHLRNIVLIDGRPTLFDAIEFNDRIGCVDTWYDLAFLLMDLWRRNLPRHANRVFNVYSTEAGNRLDDLALLPLFLSCRAAVRAKTSASAALVQDDDTGRQQFVQRARTYLAMAENLLQPAPPRLLAIGGLSGTGKSTLALHLAADVGAPPGALVLRSDEIRKALHGVRRLERLTRDAYTAEASARVYAELARQAATALGAGRSVVADAVFARAADRAAIERVAREAGVRFAGIFLDAPAEVLVDRVTRRTVDPSDADPSIVRMQLAHPVGAMTWTVVDASGSREAVATRAAAALGADQAVGVR